MVFSTDDAPGCGRFESHLLNLPAELRLLIIGYAVQNDVLTISAVEVQVSIPRSDAVESLGSHWMPRLSHGYNPELMEGTLLQQLSSKNEVSNPEHQRTTHPTTLDAIGATCQSLRVDIKGYMETRLVMSNSSTCGAPFDLYLTFPHGVCAVMERFPNILTRVRNIKIASVFDVHRQGARSCSRAMDNARSGDESQTKTELQGYHLSRLVTFLTGRNAARAQKAQRAAGLPSEMTYVSMDEALKRLNDIRARPRRILQRSSEPPRGVMAGYMQLEAGLPKLAQPLPFEHFQFRVLYPNRGGHEDVYMEIWSSETPSSLVLQHMFGGLIWLSTARGKHGTSIEIEAVPNADDGRVLASLWPKRYIEEPNRVLAAGWMDQDWEYKEWKSVARPIHTAGQ